MADPLTDPATVAGMWRPLTPAETPIAQNLIEVASAIIRRSFPLIDQWVTAGTLDPVIAGYVITEMIKAAVEAGSRPAAAKSMSESIGPYAESVTFDNSAASRLIFTDDLAALIAPPTGASTKVRTLTLGETHRYRGRRHRFGSPFFDGLGPYEWPL